MASIGHDLTGLLGSARRVAVQLSEYVMLLILNGIVLPYVNLLGKIVVLTEISITYVNAVIERLIWKDTGREDEGTTQLEPNSKHAQLTA